MTGAGSRDDRSVSSSVLMGELLAQPPESGLSGGEVRSEDDTDEFDDTGDAKDEEDIEGSGEKQF